MGNLEILAEINRLISNGFKKAAVELLTKYLDKHPNSSAAHKALGQVYLKSGQPRKAVFHLKKSLELSRKSVGTAQNTTAYDPHDFDAGDYDYVASESEQIVDEEYEFDEEETVQATPRADHAVGDLTDMVTNAEPEQLESKVEESEPIPQSHLPASVASSGDAPDYAAKNVTRATDSQIEPLVLHQQPTSTEAERPEAASNTNSGSQEDDEQNFYSDGRQSTVESVKDSDTSNYDNFPDSDELLDIDTNEDDDFEITEEIEENSEDELWDDLEDMDELDVLDEQEFDDDLDFLTYPKPPEDSFGSGDRISQEQRALQIATEVITASDWDYKHVTLLQEIFTIKGWAATRVVIEQLIKGGATPEEIELAREVRQLWTENSKYWITFHKLTPRAVDSSTDAAYKQMSWLESMRIIRCFPGTPDIEEIYSLVENTYDHWYYSHRLRRDFKAFFKFLKYRTGSMRVTLPGDYPFSFSDPLEDFYNDEYEYLHHSQSQEYRELEIMGLTPDRFVEIPPQELRKKEDMEYLE